MATNGGRLVSHEDLVRSRKGHRLCLDSTPAGRSQRDTECTAHVSSTVTIRKRGPEPTGAVWDQSLVLQDVKSGSPADRAVLGNHIGERLVTVNGVAVRTLEEAIRESQGHPVLRFGLTPLIETSHEVLHMRKAAAGPYSPPRSVCFEDEVDDGDVHTSRAAFRAKQKRHATDHRQSPRARARSPPAPHPYDLVDDAPHYSREAFQKKKSVHGTPHMTSPPRWLPQQAEESGASASWREMAKQKKLHQYDPPSVPAAAASPGTPDVRRSAQALREDIHKHRSPLLSTPRPQQQPSPRTGYSNPSPNQYTSCKLMREHRDEHIAQIAPPAMSPPAADRDSRSVSQQQYQRDKYMHVAEGARSRPADSGDAPRPGEAFEPPSILRTSDVPAQFRTQEQLKREKRLHLRAVASPQDDERQQALTRAPEKLEHSQRAMQRAKSHHLTRDDVGALKDHEEETYREAVSVPSRYILDRLQGQWAAADGTPVEVSDLDVLFGADGRVSEKLLVVRGSVRLLGHRVLRIEPGHGGLLVHWSDGDTWRRVEEGARREAAPTSSAAQVTVVRRQGEKLGLTWEGRSLTLRAVVQGSASDRSGVGRFVGRNLLRVNGKPFADAVELAEAFGRPPLKSSTNVLLQFDEPADVSM
eukprot:TRINITY_DN19409_c0_g1_i1.p1 TRINITY_DN19409_c0_g1~~TRINITY_DN19409_c0_g1_i1.p1  ORF type:complete len:661 (+),score=210.56 TRINITY_DN19409_c0_g1_i1:58-1983(+)